MDIEFQDQSCSQIGLRISGILYWTQKAREMPKKPDMFMRKNGAPPDFVLYSENHYYGTPEIDFWQFSNEIFYLGLEFFTGLLPYI